MNRKIFSASSLCLATALCAAPGCGPGPEQSSPGSRQAAVLVANGMSANGPVANSLATNGRDLNGLRLNSLATNGAKIDGVSFSSLSLGGAVLSEVRFSRGVLSARRDGARIAGGALAGAELDLTVDEPGGPAAYTLRIDGVARDDEAATGDVTLYDLSVRREGGAYASLCQDAAGRPERVVLVPDLVFDETTGKGRQVPGAVTFGCTGGAIGSCVRWGYRPWATARGRGGEPVSLREHHQACVYLKRADYCGDGTPHTVDGTTIDVYDRLSPQLQARATDWPLEAQWGPAGATCVSSRRHPEIAFSPTCLRDGRQVALPRCGARHQDEQALLFSRAE